MRIELISITPDAETVIETAGRTCYLSMPGNPQIIRKWIKSKHESVLEHASATFRISGLSRAGSHQLVRHRLASYSQQSQRYTNGDNFDFTIPESIMDNSQMRDEFLRLMSTIKMTYREMVRRGVPHEDARFILPNACHTEIVMTANFREWRRIIELRCEKHAQWEIRFMAKAIGTCLLDLAPNVFFDLKELIEEGVDIK